MTEGATWGRRRGGGGGTDFLPISFAGQGCGPHCPSALGLPLLAIPIWGPLKSISPLISLPPGNLGALGSLSLAWSPTTCQSKHLCSWGSPSLPPLCPEGPLLTPVWHGDPCQLRKAGPGASLTDSPPPGSALGLSCHYAGSLEQFYEESPHGLSYR